MDLFTPSSAKLVKENDEMGAVWSKMPVCVCVCVEWTIVIGSKIIIDVIAIWYNNYLWTFCDWQVMEKVATMYVIGIKVMFVECDLSHARFVILWVFGKWRLMRRILMEYTWLEQEFSGWAQDISEARYLNHLFRKFSPVGSTSIFLGSIFVNFDLFWFILVHAWLLINLFFFWSSRRTNN